jgi:hypothetical protein
MRIEGGTFSSFTVTPAGTDELLHWQNLNGTNDPIPTGDPFGAPQIHIGWCTVNPNDLLNMYWTDAAGLEIPGSTVYQVSGHASGSPIPGVQWDNATNHPITVTHTFYSLSRTPWKLGALNRSRLAALLFGFGALVFSVSLYALAFGAPRGFGAVTPLGGLVGWWLVDQLVNYLPYFLVVASSSFIYVALADLVPQLQKRLGARETLAQIAWLLAGIALVSAVSGLAHAH